MMQNLVTWMSDFVSSYHNDLLKETIIPFLGGPDGLLISLVFIWCPIYAIGFSIARHKKTYMKSDDILGSFFGFGFIFCVAAMILIFGGAYIALFIGGVVVIGVPSIILYFTTSMIMKGLDARKNIDT